MLLSAQLLTEQYIQKVYSRGIFASSADCLVIFYKPCFFRRKSLTSLERVKSGLYGSFKSQALHYLKGQHCEGGSLLVNSASSPVLKDLHGFTLPFTEN